jgi:hypothetical protein
MGRLQETKPSDKNPMHAAQTAGAVLKTNKFLVVLGTFVFSTAHGKKVNPFS